MHVDHHPIPDPECFGCKVLSVGVDSKHLTKSSADDRGSVTTHHRDGRVDVSVRPESVTLLSRADRG